ncbi:hypothetical protein INR49_008258 [Caranx melampygus]|nr:hypothetical protein INR49_008258 [Caranx melampygus]
MNSLSPAPSLNDALSIHEYRKPECEEQVKVSLCDQQFMKPDSRRSPYEPVEGAAEPRPLCSSSAITNMCLKSAGWWLNVSTNRYVSCLCVP